MQRRKCLFDYSIVIPFAFFVLYLLLPSHNCGTDAYFSAASVRWSGELFHPHHLLYNALAWCIYSFTKLWHIHTDVLRLMQGMNACLALFLLLVLRKLLYLLDQPTPVVSALLVFVGATFSLSRFATENEVYLLPILFSLVSAWYAARSVREPLWRQAFLSGIFGMLAVLSHEIHLFWWFGLALFFFQTNKRFFVAYLFPALAIPAAYILLWAVFPYHTPSPGDFKGFILYDFQKGMVQLFPDLWNLILSVINLFRTFYQVHGYMIYQFRLTPGILVPVLITLFLLLWGVFRKDLLRKKTDNVFKRYGNIQLVIGVLQFFWALYSVGNAEFMVMIPVLLVLYLSACYDLSAAAFFSWGCSMLCWNFFFGLLPLHQYKLQDPGHQLEHISAHPGAMYMLKQDQLIKAVHYYQTGNTELPIVIKTPDHLRLQEERRENYLLHLRQKLETGVHVFTDAGENPPLIDRSYLLKKGADEKFLKAYTLEPVDSVRLLSGYYKLYRIVP